MPLRNVLLEIQADVDARVTTDVLGDAPDIEWAMGPRELKRRAAPPRIVWVRKPGTYGPIDGMEYDALPARPLRTRFQNVDAHVWARSHVEDGSDVYCEQLSALLVAAVYRCALGSFTVNGDDWPEQDDLAMGHLCVVGFTFDTPVIDDTDVTGTTALLTAMPFDARAAAADRILTLGEGDPPDPALPV